MCTEGPWFAPGYGGGDGLKLYCYIDAVDPDHRLLRKKEEVKRGVSVTDVKRLASQRWCALNSVSIGDVTCSETLE